MEAKADNSYHFSRNIPVGDSYDIIVAGGGPAGSAAAIAAARLGAKVLLIEATGCLGGTGTSGLVNAFNPMADGEKMIVGGLMHEIVETLYRRNFLVPTISPEYWRRDRRWTHFQMEGYKLILDELTVDAGVNIQFFTRVIDVDVNARSKKVNGVIVNNIEGHRYIKAKAFIDCTGDAVLSKLCGAECKEAGIDTPNIMPPSLCSLIAGVNVEKFRVADQQKYLPQAIEDGVFTQKDRHLPGLYPVNKTVAFLNVSHLFDLNALRCKDLTDGIMLGRRLAQEYITFYRKYIPGCENIEHVATADIIGIRESRRIVGEYELNIDDYMARKTFPDQIGINNSPVDIHIYNTSDEEWKRFTEESGYYMKDGKGKAKCENGEYFGIPYGVLVPKGWSNLWVAGRCVSTDVKVHGAIRVQPPCSTMGQAAGTAAAQSIKTGQPANDLDTEQLVITLRNAKAILPQTALSKKMTRT
jgi:ribulose 1,5-bisphosphate synthetase/thiazole synthase